MAGAGEEHQGRGGERAGTGRAGTAGDEEARSSDRTARGKGSAARRALEPRATPASPARAPAAGPPSPTRGCSALRAGAAAAAAMKRRTRCTGRVSRRPGGSRPPAADQKAATSLRRARRAPLCWLGRKGSARADRVRLGTGAFLASLGIHKGARCGRTCARICELRGRAMYVV